MENTMEESNDISKRMQLLMENALSDVMGKKKVILIDCDGVIANFVKKFIEVCNDLNGTNFDNYNGPWDFKEGLGLTKEQNDMTYEGLSQPGIAASLEPLDGAIEAIQKLMEQAQVVIVSTPLQTSQTWTFDRDQWLDKHLPGVKRIYTKSKEFVCGDIFIDDKPSNVERWQRAFPDGKAIEWKHGESSWDDVLS